MYLCLNATLDSISTNFFFFGGITDSNAISLAGLVLQLASGDVLQVGMSGYIYTSKV